MCNCAHTATGLISIAANELASSLSSLPITHIGFRVAIIPVHASHTHICFTVAERVCVCVVSKHGGPRLKQPHLTQSGATGQGEAAAAARLW